MRRRFVRGRRGQGAGESRRAPIDAARSFDRIIAAGIVGADHLEPLESDDIPASYAVVGVGERDGRKLVVGYAGRNAGNALLATLAVAGRLAAEQGFDGDAIAVAPQWSASARRRLGLLGPAPFVVKAVAEASLAEDGGVVEPEPDAAPLLLPARRVAATLDRAADRELLLRALGCLEGLAAKHGGSVRGVGACVELVLLGRRVAQIRAAGERVALEILHGDKSKTSLSAAELPSAMDRLEGTLRKLLNDRRFRAGDEAMRARLSPSLAEIAGVRDAVYWPVG